MTTNEVAQRLVNFCRKGDFEGAQRELFAENAVSIEPHATPMFEQDTRGLVAIMEKGRIFTALIEQLHALSVSDPMVAGESFACVMRMDVTMRWQGRMDKTELCVYTVQAGKIVSERFHV